MSLGCEESGARSSIFLGRAVFHLSYIYPSPSSDCIYPARPHSPRSSSQNLAPPLLPSSPRPHRHHTRVGRGFLLSAAAVAVFLCQVKAWKIWTDELPIYYSQFVVFFVKGNKKLLLLPLLILMISTK